MEAFIDNIIWNLHAVDWEGTGMFAVIVLAILAMFRKWRILLLTLLTIALGWGAEDIIIMNMMTNTRILSIPFLIYCVGGGLAMLFSLISFFRMAL